MMHMMIYMMHKNFCSINNIILTYVIFLHNIPEYLAHEVIFISHLSYTLIIIAHILAKFKIIKSYLLKINVVKINIDACTNKLIFWTTDLNNNVFGNGDKNNDKNSPKLFEVLHTGYCRYHTFDSRISTNFVFNTLIFIVDTQNLTKLSIIIFCSICFSTVNYTYLLKTCFGKNLKISYIENSATYLTAFLLFAQISETKTIKNYPFIFYAARLHLYFFKVNFQAHFLKQNTLLIK